MEKKTARQTALDHGLCNCDEAYTSRNMTAPEYHAFAVSEAMDAGRYKKALQEIALMDLCPADTDINTIVAILRIANEALNPSK